MIVNVIPFLLIQMAFSSYDILTESGEKFQTVLEGDMSKKKVYTPKRIQEKWGKKGAKLELLTLNNMTSRLSTKEGLGGIKNLEHMEEFLEDTCKCLKSIAPELKNDKEFYETMVTMVFNITSLLLRQEELLDIGNFYRKTTKWIQTTRNISMISRLNRKAKAMEKTMLKGLTSNLIHIK